MGDGLPSECVSCRKIFYFEKLVKIKKYYLDNRDRKKEHYLKSRDKIIRIKKPNS